MSDRADGVRVARPLFQEEGSGSTPTSALQLIVESVAYSVARQLNRLWHSRLPRLTSPTCRVAYAAEFDNIYYAVAVWCRPIARLNPQYTWLELQRLAIAPDAPKNTASRMLAIMTRFIRRDFPDIVRLISYQDVEVHKGTIYAAAGWTPAAAETKFSEWNKSRPWNATAQSKANKIRWDKIIRPETPA